MFKIACVWINILTIGETVQVLHAWKHEVQLNTQTNILS